MTPQDFKALLEVLTRIAKGIEKLVHATEINGTYLEAIEGNLHDLWLEKDGEKNQDSK